MTLVVHALVLINIDRPIASLFATAFGDATTPGLLFVDDLGYGIF